MIQLKYQILECKKIEQENLTDSEVHGSKSSEARPSTSNQKIDPTTSERTNSQSDSATIASTTALVESSN